MAAALTTAACLLLPAAGRAQAAPPAEPGGPDEPLVEELTIEAPTGLRGAARADGLSVQVIEREELESGGERTVQEALQRVIGVHLTDEQGNGFQQDLSLRGFTASPVTGLAQGITVFLDGVRLNEPAVEEVNFDLVPLTEVERIEVYRGPSSLFGRNALGGAINVVTRRGAEKPEAEVELEAARWGHAEAHARVAGTLGPFDGYLAAGGFHEDGWRVDSSGRAARAFGKLGWRAEGTDLALSYQVQGDRLEQAGSLPPGLLAADQRANYTTGDFFRPRLQLVTVNGTRQLGPGLTLVVNGFLRGLDAEQFNSSFQSPDTRLFNQTRSGGGAAQLTWQVTLGRLHQHLSVGGEVTRNQVRIRVHEEANADNPVAGDGSALPRLLAELTDGQVALGAFVQDQARVTGGPLDGLGATASLRWDRIDHDILDTSPVNQGATGTASYRAWTPAVGVSWRLAPRWQVSASYSLGFRAPAFLELTCADPGAPCVGLQAGVAPDATLTRLRAVRSGAAEAGVQGAPLPGLTASLTAYRIDLTHDIYSVTPTGSTSVYFQNVGDTRRQGLEAALRLRRRAVDADAAYTLTRATFESDLELATARTATPGLPGTQAVRRGADLPLVPRHRLDVGVRVRPRDWVTLEAGALWVGSQVARGDEANETPRLPAYAVARAGAEVRWGPWTASLRVQNLFDRRYLTFATFAPDRATPAGPAVPFQTPGAPLRWVAGLRWERE